MTMQPDPGPLRPWSGLLSPNGQSSDNPLPVRDLHGVAVRATFVALGERPVFRALGRFQEAFQKMQLL